MTQSPMPAPFSTFIMGLASAALIEMGVMEDPVSKKKRVNREHARQHVELLNMLQQKTKGNLSSDESMLLEQVLTDLKMQFAKLPN